ncbi:MAG: hypothetical protein K8R36_09580, partial [Planctomycetales bacterium]|nr:hypothetical protein [Planctomycetales bacterium]
LVPLVWAAVPAFTQSASPIQLYFGVPNPAIGIAASARELLQNLQRLWLHQFHGIGLIWLEFGF